MSAAIIWFLPVVSLKLSTKRDLPTPASPWIRTTWPRPSRLPSQARIAVRIGIATGPVIVGDQIGEGTASETAVVGETPNLAARLQALAQPNQIVVSAATRAMLGDHFDLADLGASELKGFAETVPAWRVLSARDVESRFAATRTGSTAPLVGRQEEMGLLLRAWDGSSHAAVRSC